MASKKTLKIREKREKRVRGKIIGTQEKPRLSVFRSDKHIYAQAINDATSEYLGNGIYFVQGFILKRSKARKK